LAKELINGLKDESFFPLKVSAREFILFTTSIDIDDAQEVEEIVCKAARKLLQAH
jgi:hypothetical protein